MAFSPFVIHDLLFACNALSLVEIDVRGMKSPRMCVMCEVDSNQVRLWCSPCPCPYLVMVV